MGEGLEKGCRFPDDRDREQLCPAHPFPGPSVLGLALPSPAWDTGTVPAPAGAPPPTQEAQQGQAAPVGGQMSPGCHSHHSVQHRSYSPGVIGGEEAAR